MKSLICLFIKRDPILIISWILAIFSMIVIPPDEQYMKYLDFHTLALLFGLMSVTAGYQKTGLFYVIGEKLLHFAKDSRQLEAIVVFLCFFSSMLITNDVALITFVPFTLELFSLARLESRLIFVVVMQTIAANLGSMLLPIGNPQNIYIFTQANCSLSEFIGVTIPFVTLSFLFLLFLVLIRKKEPILLAEIKNFSSAKIRKNDLLFYTGLFLLCVLTVLRIIPSGATFLIILITIIWHDIEILKRIDYALLMTFVGFFLFVGNMGRIPILRETFMTLLDGCEVLTAIGVSQIISNVPATLLLYGFTDQWKDLLIGVNIGGLGTIIASMASLISFKYITKREPQWRGKYLWRFFIFNVLLLIVLFGFYCFMCKLS